MSPRCDKDDLANPRPKREILRPDDLGVDDPEAAEVDALILQPLVEVEHLGNTAVADGVDIRDEPRPQPGLDEAVHFLHVPD
jgi:hypothetical protein